MNDTAVVSFERAVKKRARCVLGIRGFVFFESIGLCVSALDQAATRGKYDEETVVATARQVATDTERWRISHPLN